MSGETGMGWPPPNMIKEDQSRKNVDNDSPANLEKEESLGGPMFCPPLYKQRYAAVANVVQDKGCKKLVDFGCSECKFMVFLRELPTLESVTGVDVDRRVLMEHHYMINPRASDYLIKIRKHNLTVQLYEGSITDYDRRLEGTDVVTMIEVIEHLESDILEAFPLMMFGKLRPQFIVITTPNQEFNVLFENFSGFRHPDHKFEWTRQEFQDWCSRMCNSYGYTVEYCGIGDPPAERQEVGSCSQMAIFTRCDEMSQDSEAVTEEEPYSLVANSVFPAKSLCGTPEEHTHQQALYQLRSLALSRWQDYDARMQQLDDPESGLHPEVNSVKASEEPSSSVKSQTSETEKKDAGMSSLCDAWGSTIESLSGSVYSDQDFLDESTDVFYVHVSLDYVWSCRLVREACDTIDMLREILKKAGYEFKSDEPCVVYPYHLSEPSLSDDCTDEGWLPADDGCLSSSNSCHDDGNDTGVDNQENWGSDWDCDSGDDGDKLKLVDDKGYTFNVYIRNLHKPECGLQTSNGECSCEFKGIEEDLQRMAQRDINWDPTEAKPHVPLGPVCCCHNVYPPSMADLKTGVCPVHVKSLTVQHQVEDSQFSDAEEML